jgi:hypothetical protein
MKVPDNDKTLAVYCIFHSQGLDCTNHGKLVKDLPMVQVLDTSIFLDTNTAVIEKAVVQNIETKVEVDIKTPEIKMQKEEVTYLPKVENTAIILKEKTGITTEKISTFRPMEQSYIYNEYGLFLSLIVMTYITYRYSVNSVRYWGALIEDLRSV